MTNETSYRLFAQCGLGLEPLVVKELEALGLEAQATAGGVETRGGLSAIYRIGLNARVVESLRVRLKEFKAREFSTLTKELRKLPFRAFLEPKSPVTVKVVCHKSKLWHSGAVQERCEAVLRDHAELKLSERDAAHVVHVRLDDDQVQVSLEACGRMHRRGHRTHVEKASLRETLAAALVIAGAEGVPRSDEEVVIWDPFCGAATIALEALSWGHGALPADQRKDSFIHWRNFDTELFGGLKASERERISAGAPFPKLRVIVSDQSASALASAEQNVTAAGLLSHCTLLEGRPHQLLEQIPSGAWVLTNPPYGKRLEEGGAIKELLQVMKKRKDLKPVVTLVGGAAREALPKNSAALFRTKNGGVPVSARRLR